MDMSCYCIVLKGLDSIDGPCCCSINQLNKKTDSKDTITSIVSPREISLDQLLTWEKTRNEVGIAASPHRRQNRITCQCPVLVASRAASSNSLVHVISGSRQSWHRFPSWLYENQQLNAIRSTKTGHSRSQVQISLLNVLLSYVSEVGKPTRIS